MTCGIESGYYRHRRYGTDPCEACKAAHNTAQQRRIAARRAAALDGLDGYERPDLIDTNRQFVAAHAPDLAVIFDRPTWIAHANCRGLHPNLFHPVRGEVAGQVKAVCDGCTVRADCLDYALANNIKVGVWGGTSERQRRALRRAAKAAS